MMKAKSKEISSKIFKEKSGFLDKNAPVSGPPLWGKKLK
jgi:hypothetical protein